MTEQSFHLSSFHGGLKLEGHKTMSITSPIGQMKIPARLIVPVHQHIGDTGDILVQQGDRVLKGQPLTHCTSYVSAPVHAPSSGIISDIAEYKIPHPSGLSALCIVIDTDGRDEWTELKPVADYQQLDAAELRNLIRHAGIVGLGGAAFPTAVKLNPGPDHHIETVIFNGAECEPYITCDDMLMRERADEIISGIEISLHALNTANGIIAIESNKPEAIGALKQAIKKREASNIRVVSIPTRYPTGGEKQLIKVITGKEVPSNGLPADIGIIVQNVGTMAAIHQAVHAGKPLISRIVTVTGKGIKKPRNLDTLIGTPMSELIAECGGYKEQADHLVMGGPMMGFTLNSDQLPIIKGCNCLLVESSQDNKYKPRQTMPCIRCGECTRVCPASLLPQQLYWYASSKNFDKVQDYHLFDCIECGCCAYVCPSQIPLVQYYRYAKTEIWNLEREKQKADHARMRHDFRQARLEKEKQEREERLRKKKEMLDKKKQEEASESGTDPKQQAIEAALARVQAKKEKAGITPRNTENLTEEQNKQIAEVDKRRQKTKAE